jgi:AbiV family abortive infection protein
MNEDELKNGVGICLLNAESLISDAELLKNNGRKERAYTLFQLASEEIGKASQVLNFLLLKDINDANAYKLFLKQFLDHKAKTNSFISFDYFVLMALKEQIVDKKKFLEATIYEFNNLKLLNDLKNYSLYTSIIDDKFLSPKQLITNEHLNHIEFRINTRYKLAKFMLETATKVSHEIREFQLNTPIDEEQLRIKTVDEIVELLSSN